MIYWILKAILGPFLKLVFRPWTEGLSYIPTEGPAVLASNHLSFLDSVFLPLMCPRHITFLAKSEYFTGRGPKGWFKKFLFSGLGQVPLDRSGGAAAERALRAGLRVLSDDKLLGIYPEGTRSPDGRLYRGKVGVARMALEAGVPVIPVAMVGTFETQPAGQIMPKIKRVGVRVGRPLDFSRYQGKQNDRFVLRAMTDEIMYELMVLSGQEYVDVYASTAKREIEEAHRAAAESVGGLDRARAGRPRAVAHRTLPPVHAQPKRHTQPERRAS